MPPIIKWACAACGETRIMNPGTDLVLCSNKKCTNMYKQMERIGNLQTGEVYDKKFIQNKL